MYQVFYKYQYINSKGTNSSEVENKYISLRKPWMVVKNYKLGYEKKDLLNNKKQNLKSNCES